MTHTLTDRELAQLLRQHALEEQEGMSSCMSVLFWIITSWAVVILFGWGLCILIRAVLSF